jgi:hypothetical protein
MLNQPNALELLAAVRGYLESTAIPNLSGHAAFHGKVAANVVAILERELAHGPAALGAEQARLSALLGREGSLEGLRADLCAQFENGALDAQSPGVLAHLLQTAADRVAIEQPTYASMKRVG